MKRKIFLSSSMGLLFMIYYLIAVNFGMYIYDYYNLPNGLGKSQIRFSIETTDEESAFDLIDHLNNKCTSYSLIRERFGKTSLYLHESDVFLGIKSGRLLSENDCISDAAVCLVSFAYYDKETTEYGGNSVIGWFEHKDNLVHKQADIVYPLCERDALAGRYYIVSDMDRDDLKKIIKDFSDDITITENDFVKDIKEIMGIYILPKELVGFVGAFVILGILFSVRMWVRQYSKELHIRWLCGASSIAIYKRLFLEKLIIDFVLGIVGVLIAFKYGSQLIVAIFSLLSWIGLNSVIVIIVLLEYSNGFKRNKA